MRKTGDYAKRQGVCGVPVTETDLTKNIPVCHSKIRSFEWIVELVVRYLSHQKWATPSNGVKYTKEELTFPSVHVWYKYQAASWQLQKSHQDKRMTGFRLSWRVENK